MFSYVDYSGWTVGSMFSVTKSNMNLILIKEGHIKSVETQTNCVCLVKARFRLNFYKFINNEM